MAIVRHVVFDIGNVLLRWDPAQIVRTAFPNCPDQDALTQALFKSDTWREFNRGLFSEEALIEHYHATLGIALEDLRELMVTTKHSLTPMPGSVELFERLYQAGIPLYCITDNVHELVDYIKATYDFWKKFQGTAVSAEIGVLKPNPLMYQYLLETYDLHPQETIFFDDLGQNVEAARKLGMHAEIFTTATTCEQVLRETYRMKF